MTTTTTGTGRSGAPKLGQLMLGFFGLQLVVNLANGGVTNSLVPNQIAMLDPEGKVVALGLASGVAAIVALVAQPLWGLLSDRTRTRWGRRAPWILAGVFGLAAGILALIGATSILVVVLLAGVINAFYSMVAGPLAAILPDRTPVDKRGLFSALGGLGVFIGGLAGIIVASAFVTRLPLGFVVLASVLLIGAIPLVFTLREPADSVPPIQRVPLRATLAGFFVNPRQHPDFAWAFVARLLLVVGFWSVISFQLYILADYVGLGLAEANVVYPIVTAIMSVAIIVALVPSGAISDRIGRRKPIVVIASIIVAASTVPPILWPSTTTAMVSIGIAGLGIGMYLAVDQALMTQVLPNASDAGKDLGVLNVAQAGGQAIAPLVASLVIGVAGYAGLYAFAGVLTVLAALAIVPIRSVR